MSLLNTAKLVVTPNAFKTSKLYSIIPSDGSGDFSVVRATNASFVNSLGVIEDALPNIPRLDFDNVACPAILVESQKTNFLTNSNAASAGTGVSYTIDAILAPNGIMEADYIQDTAANSEHYSEKQFNVAATTQYTYSIFAKGDGSGKKVYLRTALRGVFGIQVDLATGVVAVVGAIPPTAYGAIFYPTLGYWRIYMTYTSTTAGVAVFRPQIMSSGGAAVYTGNGTGYYVWGQQLETGTLSSQITTGATSVTRNADIITVAPPVGTTNITTTFENGTTEVITTILPTFTIPNGRINNIVMT